MPAEIINPLPDPVREEAPLVRNEPLTDSNHTHPFVDKQLELIWKELGNLRNDIRWVIGLSVCTLGWIVMHVR